MIPHDYRPWLWGLLLWLLAVLWFWREAVRHRRNRDRIALRIHVNGTRGKSGVTRLIAAGLRAGGLRTVAKTTGSAARLIEPDGSERPLPRRGPANIREMIPCVAHAAAVGAAAFVAECMALRPELQWFIEHRLLASRIGVITNIRADHEDVMGEGVDAVAAALAATIPAGGTLVTGPAEYRLLQQTGCIGGAAVHIADAAALPPQTGQGFAYELFPQNLALALAVCELAGVDRETALSGMRQAAPDPGHLTITRPVIAGTAVSMINALAANDPDSTAWLYRRYISAASGTVLVWLHGRPDRKLRSAQLCQALAALHAGPFLVSGDSAFLTGHLAACGVDKQRIGIYRGDGDLGRRLASLPQPVTIFAAGNIHGLHSSLLTITETTSRGGYAATEAAGAANRRHAE